MNKRRELPAFANEAEEAQWWYDNREKHAEEFVQAMKDGRVTRGAMVRRGLVRTPTVMIPAADFADAQALAEKKGMSHGTYIQGLVHEALQREKQLVG
jgi:predicted nucleic acid-binding Zn ribbon protein